MHFRSVLSCGAAAIAMVVAAPALAQTVDFDIPAQSLSSAITDFGRQSGIQIVAPAKAIRTLDSSAIKGPMDARAALRQLIEGTGLEIADDDGSRIVLRRAAAPAAKAAVPSDKAAEGEIVVTGIKGSLNSAREIKRNSDSIVDAVAAEDIGQLPDNSATEALARLPGVQIFRNRGEGQAITIRGISSVVTTINGQEAYTGASRRTLLNSYPSGLIRSMEVYKALTPDLIEGGIGGAVNVELRQPLDFTKGLTAAGTIRASYDDQADKLMYNGDILVAQNWDTSAGEIGVMLNASYTRRDYYESYRENLQPQDTAYGQLPSGILVKNPKGHYERPVLTGAIQWRPAYNFGMYLRATNVTDDNEYTDTDFQTNIAAATVLNDVELVEGTDIIKSASFTATANSGPRSNHTRQKLDTTQIEFGADFTSGIATLTTSAVYTTSRIDTDEQLFLLAFNEAPTIDATFQSDSKWGGLSYSYRDIDLTDIDQFHVRAYSDTRQRQKGEGLQWRGDLELDAGNDFLRSIKLGYRYAWRTARSREGSDLVNLNPLGLPMSDFPGGGDPVVLSRSPGGDDAAIPSGWVGYDAGFLGNEANVIALNDYITTLPGMGGYFTDGGRPADNPESSFDGDESSFAAYGSFKYGFELAGIPIDGVAGVRAVNTWLSIDGWQRVRENTPDTGGTTISRYEPIDGRQNYLDIDPSISAVVHLTPRLQLRGAWTKTFSRPDFRYLNPTVYLVQVATASGAYNGIATAGNPDLQPVRSNNYDVSLEYYFGRTGAITLAGFYRDVDGYLVRTTYDDDTIPGALGTVEVTKYVNAGDGYIKGVEVSASTFFDFAPGILRNFGVSANYTYIDSQQDLPATEASTAFSGQTPGISQHSYNAALFYDDGQFRAKVAYAWRDDFTLSYNLSDPRKNLNWYPISRLAASATYNFRRNLSLTVDGTNLLNRPQRAYWGTKENTDRVYFEGRVFSAALRFKY